MCICVCKRQLRVGYLLACLGDRKMCPVCVPTEEKESFAACIWISVLLGQNCQSACLLSLCSFLILCSRQGIEQTKPLITKRAPAVTYETWSRCGGKCKVSF